MLLFLVIIFYYVHLKIKFSDLFLPSGYKKIFSISIFIVDLYAEVYHSYMLTYISRKVNVIYMCLFILIYDMYFFLLYSQPLHSTFNLFPHGLNIKDTSCLLKVFIFVILCLIYVMLIWLIYIYFKSITLNS